MKRILICFLLAAMLLMSACTSEPAVTQPSETQTSTDKQTEKQTEKQTDKSTQDISGGGATPETPEPPSDTNDVEEKMYHITYVIGSISGAQGEVIANAKRFRTSGYLDISKIEAISINAGYCLTWFAYVDAAQSVQDLHRAAGKGLG